MSSGFVPALSADDSSQPHDDWATAQQAIEDNARQKQQEGRQTGNSSLYDILQQNKSICSNAFVYGGKLRRADVFGVALI
jgi:hypothetical protein